MQHRPSFRKHTIHDPHCRVLWEDNHVHSRETDLGALDNFTNLFGIGHDFLIGVQSRHGVLKDADPDSVRGAGNLKKMRNRGELIKSRRKDPVTRCKGIFQSFVHLLLLSPLVDEDPVKRCRGDHAFLCRYSHLHPRDETS